MKIRTGFVSNSSSSSFCLYGKTFFLTESDSRDNASYEVEKRCADLGLDCFFSWENEMFKIGLSPWVMGEEETKSAFKKRVEAVMDEFSKDSYVYKNLESSGVCEFECGEIYD